MTDRELLEMAAKASGTDIYFRDEKSSMPITVDKNWPWNPLLNDGDALRLAAKLKIDISWQSTAGPISEPTVETYVKNEEGFCAREWEFNYRTAIVRAAADVGINMP